MSALSQASGMIEIATQGPGFTDVTGEAAAWLAGHGFEEGLLTLFLRHTSASLVIQENADPDVQADLLDALGRFAPESARYRHSMEGADDMPAHIKAMLTPTSLAIPVIAGRPALGTWQGIYLVEHRVRPHHRQIALNVIGTRR